MATSIIKFHPFSGTNEDEPPCYLLQIDEFHCLLDCGWDSKFSDNYVDQILKYKHIINAVFISHPDVRHMGALPYLVGKCGLTCPVYTTSLVKQMGQLFLYDIFLSINTTEKFDKFTLDDVDAATGHIVDLKYQQTINLGGKGKGVTVTPYVAGHMIGGTIWKIVKDDLEIVYAIDYNHKKENHLNGAVFSGIQRPHLLITSSYHTKEKVRKKNKDDLLKKMLHETLKINGNILFLSDTAGRSLELVHLLDKIWCNRESGFMAYRLAFANTVATNVIEVVKSSVEWLSDDLTHSFETADWKPFHLKHTTLCNSTEDVNSIEALRVAVVSQSHLNYGIGRDLFSKWCSDEKNLIVVTARDREQCLATELLKHAKATLGSADIFNLKIQPEYRLSNEDVIKKLTREFLIKSENGNQSYDENTMIVDDDLNSEDEDSIKMELEEPINVKNNRELSLFIQDDNGTSCPDVSGFRLPGFDIHAGQHSHSRRLGLVFPSTERKVAWDIYGEHIDVNDPNFINTPGSSYAIRMMNDEMCLNDGQRVEGLSGSKKLYHSGNGMSSELRNQLMRTGEEDKDRIVRLAPEKDLLVKCSIVYQDYEGLADGAAMQQMITNCKPQEIIIVGGNRQDSEMMSYFCKASLHMNESLVHIAASGQVINCTKEGHIYQVRMSDALVSSLSFQRVGNYELAWIDAVIKMPVNDALVCTEDQGQALVEVSQITSLELPGATVTDHNTIFINEPKLSDLKQLLINKGHNAEITGGVLVVDNCVAIWKNELGKLMLEGAFGDTYFEVREVLYSQFAIL